MISFWLKATLSTISVGLGSAENRAGRRNVVAVVAESKLCDMTVWHMLWQAAILISQIPKKHRLPLFDSNMTHLRRGVRKRAWLGIEPRTTSEFYIRGKDHATRPSGRIKYQWLFDFILISNYGGHNYLANLCECSTTLSLWSLFEGGSTLIYGHHRRLMVEIHSTQAWEIWIDTKKMKGTSSDKQFHIKFILLLWVC